MRPSAINATAAAIRALANRSPRFRMEYCANFITPEPGVCGRSATVGRRFYDRAVLAPPPAMQPQPLLGVLPHPPLDHSGDRLHRAHDVDPSLGITRCLDSLGQLEAKAVIGQANGASAVDRAIEPSRQPRQRGVGLAAAAEKLDVDPHGEVLIDQHPDMDTALERIRDAQRRLCARRNECAHHRLANAENLLAQRRHVRALVDDRAVEMEFDGGERRQLPIRQVCAEPERRPPAVAQALETLDAFRRDDDPPPPWAIHIEVGQRVEMSDLGPEATEIVPARRPGCDRPPGCGLAPEMPRAGSPSLSR